MAWFQRGMEPPVLADGAGRPELDPAVIRAEYDDAVAFLRSSGKAPTVAHIAEVLGLSERTLRDRRARFDLR